jgi:hypothetical protein
LREAKTPFLDLSTLTKNSQLLRKPESQNICPIHLIPVGPGAVIVDRGPSPADGSEKLLREKEE